MPLDLQTPEKKECGEETQDNKTRANIILKLYIIYKYTAQSGGEMLLEDRWERTKEI